MKANRLEAFSDGVLAIIITIMVLELKIPEGHTWEALRPLAPKILSYVLSFVYIGIYWNNHHHMVHMLKQVSGTIMWLNLMLLFWLSLVPFTTGWMGESKFASTPTALYGIFLLMAAISYWLLQRAIFAQHPPDSALKQSIGRDLKGRLSPIIYFFAIAFAYMNVFVSCLLYALVALIWFVPDKRIEHALAKKSA